MNDNQSSDPNAQLQGELISIMPPLWRSQLVRILEVLGVIAMFLGGAEFLNLLNALPGGVAPQWAFLIGGVVNKTAKPVIEFFGDWFDDGVINKSFKIGPTVALVAILCALSLFLSSCAATYSVATGQPIRTTPVQREDGKPFNVATSDIYRAESQPEAAWGLYNAGAVAATAREVISSGK